MNRKNLLEEKAKKQSNRIPLVSTYNRTLPNVKRAISNNWNLLHINQEFKDLFQKPPILAFRRNRNLYDLLGCKNVVDGKVQRLSKKKKLDFPPSVSQNRETYAASKLYTRNILKAM